MSIRRVENHTDQFICLPPLWGVAHENAETGEVDYVDFPHGIKLEPGLNSVPGLYLAALHEQRRQMSDRRGAPRVGSKGEPLFRFPGREALKILTEPVTYTTASGLRFGPRVTVHESALADRADGPAAPTLLPTNLDAAMTIINVTDDRNALDRWLRAAGKDANRKALIMARISTVSRLGVAA